MGAASTVMALHGTLDDTLEARHRTASGDLGGGDEDEDAYDVDIDHLEAGTYPVSPGSAERAQSAIGGIYVPSHGSLWFAPAPGHSDNEWQL